MEGAGYSQARGPDELELILAARTGGSRLGRIGRSNLAAWCISLALHAAVFASFYGLVVTQRAEPARVIIPEARLVSVPEPAAAVSEAPLRLARETPAEPPKEVAPPGIDALPGSAPRVPEALAAVAMPSGAGAFEGGSISAAMAAPFAGGAGTGSGAAAAGAGSGGPHRAASGPPSGLFGQGGNAYKVVYVVDLSASVSMMYLDDVVRELRRSIDDLVPTQRFHIVLTLAGEVQEFEPRRLTPAISKFKTQAGAFLDRVSTFPKAGRADPVEAMRRAFAVGPELIYFLSDGDYENIEGKFEDGLRQLNRDHSVKITTIAFDPSPKPRALLERIAREHGGHFRVVETK
jgi:hypothetical protein